MEKPSSPIQSKKPTSTQNRRKPPSPKELISHYESQGHEPEEAAVKVIEDLQNVLQRVITSSRGKRDKSLSETSRKVDNINTRLAIVDMKLDSKPGYPETFALGVASGLALQGIGSVVPLVVKAFGEIWGAVSSVTENKHSSP